MDTPQNPWVTLGQQEIYDNPWIQVKEYTVINPSGKPGIYGKVHFKNLAIGIIPLDADHNTWLVGQYRFVLNAYSWEIPEGGGPLGQDPLQSAQRELREETGLTAKKWDLLMTMHLSNSVSDEMSLIFLARDLYPEQPMPEETEQLQVQKVPFEEVYQKVLRGEITDAMSVAAVFKIKLMMLDGTIS